MYAREMEVLIGEYFIKLFTFRTTEFLFNGQEIVRRTGEINEPGLCIMYQYTSINRLWVGCYRYEKAMHTDADSIVRKGFELRV